MNFIEHVHEPERLLLVWQGPEGSSRRRFEVAELLRAGEGQVRLKYLLDTECFHAARLEGFDIYPAFRKLEPTYDLGVVETFMRRLPPRKREDYPQYLEQFRLRPQTEISDFALLAYTGAKLPGDGFSIINPLSPLRGKAEVMIEVAGFRHAADMTLTELSLGQAVTFVTEDGNIKDPNAVAIYADGRKVGFVPRQQTEAVRALMRHSGITAQIERINGSTERPLVYLLARLDGDASFAAQRRFA
ncbi:MAG: HIRAN domain-containing protein [Pseudomonadota bacterium]